MQKDRRKKKSNKAESRTHFNHRNSLITLGLNSTHVKLISDRTDIAVCWSIFLFFRLKDWLYIFDILDQDTFI